MQQKSVSSDSIMFATPTLGETDSESSSSNDSNPVQ